jgi:hypothetical protein
MRRFWSAGVNDEKVVQTIRKGGRIEGEANDPGRS